MKLKWPGKVLLERRGVLVTRLSIDNTQVVLKASLGRDPLSKYLIEAETVALEILKGLAVPKRVIYPRIKAINLLKTQHFYHVVTEWIPEKSSHGKKFTIPQALALWGFALEQMCAFRRKKIIYTDLKSDHIYVSNDLTKARFIDFDSCIMREPRGLYPMMSFRYTPTLSAPELHLSKVHTENVIVYQIGMLLGSFLLGDFSNSDLNRETLHRIKTKFRKFHLQPIFEVFEKCLSKNPKNRPKNLEVLFEIFNNVQLPRETYDIWSKLRAPYIKELGKLGFEEPLSLLPTKKAA